MRLVTIAAIALTGMACAGCMTEETQRLDGITYGAGDSLAANTAMQMVDPWQYGVQDTDLEVPADRAGAVARQPSSDTSGDTSTTSYSGTKTTGG